MRTRKPAKLGTVWTPMAKIQRMTIDPKNTSRMIWETLDTCRDTPNAIRAAVAKLIRKGYTKSTMWVVGQATNRKMVIDLEK